MANFRSSTGALENLLIGLARGYWKERRRILKRGADFASFCVQDIRLREEFVKNLTEGLGEYFPLHQKQQVAKALLHMIEDFTERRK